MPLVARFQVDGYAVRKVEGLETAEAAEQLSEEERKKKRTPLWQWVRDGKVDAALLLAPSHLYAADAGLKVIDIEPLPMIWFTTISSSLPFVQKNPGIVERFLKGMIEGIHFFKTQPEKSIDIIQRRYDKEGKLNREQATYIYQQLAPALEPKLYPSMAAIANVYEEAKRQDADAKRINPMELWDLHHLRQLEDVVPELDHLRPRYPYRTLEMMPRPLAVFQHQAQAGYAVVG